MSTSQAQVAVPPQGSATPKVNWNVQIAGDRVIHLNPDGNLEIYYGSIRQWPHAVVHDGSDGDQIVDFSVAGNQVAIVTKDGDVYVRDFGGLQEGWYWVAKKASKVGIADSGVVFQEKEGSHRVMLVRYPLLDNRQKPVPEWDGTKDGSDDPKLHATSFAVSGSRFAVITASEKLWVKDDSQAHDRYWHPLAEDKNVIQVVLDGNRIVYRMKHSGEVWLWEGPVSKSMKPVVVEWKETGRTGDLVAVDVRAAGKRIAVRTYDNEVWAKGDAQVDTRWFQVNPPTSDMEFNIGLGPSLLAIDFHGSAFIWKGDIVENTRWTELNNAGLAPEMD